MLNIIDRPEKLWKECVRLAKEPKVIASELYDTPDDHLVLAYGPVAQRNQFQSLLYSAQDNFNVSILPIHKLELCGEIPWPGRVVCHFHWLDGNTRHSNTQEDADAAVIYWETLIRRIKEKGHKIVWTVHNIMPHETLWVEQDRLIRQMMADAADALHVMASDSARLAEGYYTLDPRKTFIVPHPTYEGAQPDGITRAEARAQLQIHQGEFVFLSFGAIMEYKGYDQLMTAYDELRGKTATKTRLIIAGLPSDKELAAKIAHWGTNKRDVILDMKAVPHEKLQIYFRSADFAICPYHRTLNSGVAMMAITFGLPVLGPNSGSFLDIEKIGCGITFDNTQATALMEKMRFLADHKLPPPDKLIEARKALAPLAISESFFTNIRLVVT